jgi:hypothetical protein
MKRYLDSASCKNVIHPHTTPLPSGFTPLLEDLFASDALAHDLSIEYKIDLRSCIGSLIYLNLNHTDNLYAVNKLDKFAHHPGKVYFEVLVHVLHYLRDNTFWGVKFYSDPNTAPVRNILSSNNLPMDAPFFTMCDSPWNDDIDHGRSTGCFLIFYMSGIIDHSSNLLDHIALSSAEAEYNQACLAIMATTHANMILEDLIQQSFLLLLLFLSSWIAKVALPLVLPLKIQSTLATFSVVTTISVRPSTPTAFIPIGLLRNSNLQTLALKISHGLVIPFCVPFAWFLLRIAQSKRGDRISESL